MAAQEAQAAQAVQAAQATPTAPATPTAAAAHAAHAAQTGAGGAGGVAASAGILPTQTGDVIVVKSQMPELLYVFETTLPDGTVTRGTAGLPLDELREYRRCLPSNPKMVPAPGVTSRIQVLRRRTREAARNTDWISSKPMQTDGVIVVKSQMPELLYVFETTSPNGVVARGTAGLPLNELREYRKWLPSYPNMVPAPGVTSRIQVLRRRTR